MSHTFVTNFITFYICQIFRCYLPEKKLPVEVGHVNCVHVNHMDKAKPRQGLH